MNALNILGLSGREQIPAEDIIYLEADINYTTIYTVSKPKHTMSFTLRKVEERIAGSDFLRINRGLSINRNYLQTISHLKKAAFVTMSNGIMLPVSRRRYNNVKENFEIA
jgi:two-component system, LytTR family, response regulator